MDKFTPLTTAGRSESVAGSWKSQDSPDTQLRVSDRLYPIVVQAAQARWTSQFSQRKLLAASVLPKPTCTATPTPVFGTVTHFFFQFLDLLESLVLISGVVSIRYYFTTATAAAAAPAATAGTTTVHLRVGTTAGCACCWYYRTLVCAHTTTSKR